MQNNNIQTFFKEKALNPIPNFIQCEFFSPEYTKTI